MRQAELQQVASNAVKVGEGSRRHTSKEMDQSPAFNRCAVKQPNNPGYNL